MKKIVIPVICCLFIITVAAQIPNNGFETWISKGNYENPDLWGNLNNSTAIGAVYTCTKATPGNPGSYYLKLISKTSPVGIVPGIACSGKLDSVTRQPKSGFAFTQRPKSLTGKWQHMIYGTTQGFIQVTLTKWNSTLNQRDVIASATNTLSGMDMSWASFTFDLVYQSGADPDSCIIFLSASGNTPANNDYLWVDDLAFAGTVTGLEKETSYVNSMIVFPNPARDVIHIDLKRFDASTPVQVKIYNSMGNLVYSENAEKSSLNLPVSRWSNGFYTFLIIQDQKSAKGKFMIAE